MKYLLYAYLFFIICITWVQVLSKSLLWLGAKNADFSKKVQRKLLLESFGFFILFLIALVLLVKSPEYVL